MKNKKELMDLSKKQELSIAVMNLISIEEHLAFTAMKTGKKEYLAALNSIREMRKKYLKKLLTNTEGELWCISKHLLSTTMRLMETGTKHFDNMKEAAEYFDAAFDAYTLFWLLQGLGKGNSNGNIKKTRETKK